MFFPEVAFLALSLFLKGLKSELRGIDVRFCDSGGLLTKLIMSELNSVNNKRAHHKNV